MPGQRGTTAEIMSVAELLARLTPDAHSAFTATRNGSGEARLRQPDGTWSAPVTLRPSRFAASARWWSDERPGWCTECGDASTWRADPPPAAMPSVLHWRCVRCNGA